MTAPESTAIVAPEVIDVAVDPAAIADILEAARILGDKIKAATGAENASVTLHAHGLPIARFHALDVQVTVFKDKDGRPDRVSKQLGKGQYGDFDAWCEENYTHRGFKGCGELLEAQADYDAQIEAQP